MRDLVKMPNFNGVAAGQTATVNLPAQDTYHRLFLTYTESGTLVTEANMKAAITEVRLLINGKIQRRFSANELITLNALRGDGYSNGYLTIYFSEPWRRTPQAEDMLAWGMADVATFAVEVDIAAGRTAPALSAKALIGRGERDDQGRLRGLGGIMKWRKHPIGINVSGLNNVSTLPKGDAYSSLHCFSGNINSVVVTTGGLERFNATSADITEILSQEGMARQANVFSVIFDNTKRLADVLPTAGLADFRVDFDMAAAASFTMLTEVYGRAD